MQHMICDNVHFNISENENGKTMLTLLNNFVTMLDDNKLELVLERCMLQPDKIREEFDPEGCYKAFEKFFFDDDKTFIGSVALTLKENNKIRRIDAIITSKIFKQKGGNSEDNTTLLNMFDKHYRFNLKYYRTKKISFYFEDVGQDQNVSICDHFFSLGSYAHLGKCCDNNHLKYKREYHVQRIFDG